MSNLTGLICPVCKAKEAKFYATVDVYSDADIPACEDCADILSQGTLYQWNNNAPEAWLEENKVKIDNAFDELHREYERMAKLKKGTKL